MVRLGAWFDYLVWGRLRWRAANRRLRRFDPLTVGEGFHGQYGQDAFVVDHFRGKRGGVFVDIGANDGVSLSNTYYLERELGWSGLLVEPHAEMHAALQRVRTAHAVNACAADHDGVARFSQIEGGSNMLSGVASKFSHMHERRVRRSMRKSGSQLREVEVPAVRVDRVLEDVGIDRVDYLSIDTEGGEREIIDAIDLERFGVELVTMENNGRDLSTRRYMRDRGYEIAAVLGCDEVFVRRAPVAEARVAA